MWAFVALTVLLAQSSIISSYELGHCSSCSRFREQNFDDYWPDQYAFNAYTRSRRAIDGEPNAEILKLLDGIRKSNIDQNEAISKLVAPEDFAREIGVDSTNLFTDRIVESDDMNQDASETSESVTSTLSSEPAPRALNEAVVNELPEIQSTDASIPAVEESTELPITTATPHSDELLTEVPATQKTATESTPVAEPKETPLLETVIPEVYQQIIPELQYYQQQIRSFEPSCPNQYQEIESSWPLQQLPQQLSLQFPQPIAEQTPLQMQKPISADMLQQQLSHHVQEKITSQQNPQKIGEQIPQQMPEQLSQQILDQVPQYIPQQFPQPNVQQCSCSNPGSCDCGMVSEANTNSYFVAPQPPSVEKDIVEFSTADLIMEQGKAPVFKSHQAKVQTSHVRKNIQPEQNKNYIFL